MVTNVEQCLGCIPDDDAMVAVNKVVVSDLSSHSAWEKIFCSKLSASPFESFKALKSCKINVEGADLTVDIQ